MEDVGVLTVEVTISKGMHLRLIQRWHGNQSFVCPVTKNGMMFINLLASTRRTMTKDRRKNSMFMFLIGVVVGMVIMWLLRDEIDEWLGIR